MENDHRNQNEGELIAEPEKKYQCGECGKTFETRKELEHHIGSFILILLYYNLKLYK